MSNYTKTTNFASKDNLSPGNPLKIVKGTEIDTEFNNIATAVATKTDNASANITGGSITGITDLAIADGGTGASTANAALNNLLPSQASASGKYLKSNGTDSSWDALDISTADITGTLPVANGGTGVTSSTGTGSVVLSNSPSLVTPALGTPASGVATNLTGLPLSTGVTGTLPIANGGTGQTTANAAFNALAPSQATASGKYLKSDGTNTSWDALDISTADITGTLPVANGGTGVTTSTGTGSVVLSNSPTLVTPALGTPSSATLTNATGLPISTGVSGLGTGVATALAVNVGSAGAPIVNGGVLGTPSSGTATNLTGLPISTGVSGLGTGVATALAVNVGSAGAPVVNGGVLGTPSSGTATNLTGLPLSTGVTGTLAVTNGGTGVTTSTGSGNNVLSTSPTLVTPILGTPTSATLTNATGLPLSTGVTGTLPIANGGTGQTSYTDGQLLIGNSTGNTLSKATLTAGSNITITNGNGSITIASTGGGSSQWTTTGSDIYYNTGNVGIGTSSPGTKLDVNGTMRIRAGNTFYFQNSAADANATIVAAGGSGNSSLSINNGAGAVLIGTSTEVSGGGCLQIINGITFPATQSASSNANTLDDYEEGTWTPSLGGSATYNARNGSYIKIGQLVYVHCYLSINAISTGSTTVVSGLPFNVRASAADRNQAGSINFFNGLATSVVSLFCQPISSSTTVNFPGLTAASQSVINPVTVFQDGTQIYFSAVYQTNT